MLVSTTHVEKRRRRSGGFTAVALIKSEGSKTTTFDVIHSFRMREIALTYVRVLLRVLF